MEWWSWDRDDWLTGGEQEPIVSRVVCVVLGADTPIVSEEAPPVTWL